MNDEEQKAAWYRQKAEELRVEAESAKTPEIRESLLKIAQTYEELAIYYEKSIVRRDKPD